MERPTESEAQFALAFAEAPVGMVLITPEGGILDANRAFLDMIGYRADEVVGRDSSHFTHPDDVQPTREFFSGLRAGGARKAGVEKRYIRRDGRVLWVRASAAIYSCEPGRPARVIATVEDITDRKRVEERLRAIYDGTYEYIGLLAPDGTVLEANRASLEFAGNAREDVVGRPFWDTPWLAFTPGASEAARDAVARAAAGEFVRYDTNLHRPSGEILTFDISLHPVRDGGGKVVLIVPEGRDITTLKVLETRNAFLVRLDDATRTLTDPLEVMQTAARLLGEHLEASRCAYVEVGEDQDAFEITGDYVNGVPSVAGRYRFSQFGQIVLETMRAGEAFVFANVETDPRLTDVAEDYRRIGARSGVCVPLHKGGRVIAAMALNQATPRKWRPDEVELTQLVSNRCWESLQRARVTRELREREQHFRFLSESIPQMLWTGAPDGSLNFLSEQGLTYLGISEEELLGSGWLAVVHQDDLEKAIEDWMRAIKNRVQYETSYRLRRHDGKWRWHLVRGVPMMGQDGAVVQWYGTCTDIDDQKQAEAKLQQQWQIFDTALSHTPDNIYILDLDGRFSYANESYLALLQKSYDEVIGRNLLELGYPREISRRLSEQIQQVIQTKQPLRDDMRFGGASGEVREWEHIFVPVLSADGSVRAVTGSSRDITQQKLAEDMIKEDRRRWQELLQSAPAAIAVLRGPEHRYEWVNPDYVRLVGRSEEKMLGQPLGDVLPELTRQGYLDKLNRVFTTGQPYGEHEAPVLLEDAGELKVTYINFALIPTRDSQGDVYGVFIHATNVTDLVGARKQVEDREQQFRTLAETIPHLAWMAEADGYLFWYNRRWYEFTGTTAPEMAGWGWQKVHDPDVLPQVIQQWKRSLASGEPLDMVFPLRAANGTFRTFLTRVEPVKDNEGRVVRWFGTNTDITDQKRTEEELRRINRNLEEFSYAASHDLQEPLRMVNIYTQLMLKTAGDADGKLGHYAGFVRQGVARMEALIRDLLVFSQAVHSGDPPVGTADLEAALSEALAVLKNRIEESGAAIDGPKSLPLVSGDTAQLAHVFQNILSNALKYRKKGTKPEILITAESEGAECIVAVQDNGIGFEQAHADRIFGLFKRLHKDDYPGTGLGLAICKRIVERYGGRMWAEGVPGEGAIFRFALPRRDAR